MRPRTPLHRYSVAIYTRPASTPHLQHYIIVGIFLFSLCVRTLCVCCSSILVLKCCKNVPSDQVEIFGLKLYYMLGETAAKSKYLSHVMRQLLVLVVLSTISFAIKGAWVWSISTMIRDQWVC